ncbi:protein phosphatase regulator [Coniosporium tulheliwenetii]|uniref:Protein phosphatase regulator n=1 Tax=Coniosporium tulheliwenetii TaxID=3383036 RepID=A0ACC2ZFF1_9PEZI|nr:protein phosphatase regulator [Cladosporium sp. JES 115]
MAQVLPAQGDGQSYFGGSPLRGPSPSQSPFIHSQSDLSHPSFHSKPESSISLNTECDGSDAISFPTYDGGNTFDQDEDLEPPPSPVTDNSYTVPSTANSPTSESIPGSGSIPEHLPAAEDDTAIKTEPSRHVDYLSHDWREEDIWSSWRHIVSQRKMYGERSRLENASWRTWVKSKYKLKTVSPETLNWDPTDYFSSSRSSTSGVDTPELEKKHIRFDDKVEQCIAVDCQRCDYDEEEDENSYVFRSGEDDDSDEGVVMMKKSKKRRQPKRTSSRGSATSESKTIAKLPSTTLKYRTDSPDMSEQHSIPSPNFFRSSKLSPSPSQETLRPTNPSRNFLIGDDDDDDMDVSWEPSGAFSNRRDSVAVTQNRMLSPEDEDERREGSSGLRRTPSGMFMPYEDDEDDIVAAGLFGKVVDTVNTAKDIAHVIWNVGWRR